MDTRAWMLVAALGSSFAATAAEMRLWLGHEYGEFVDRGYVYAYVYVGSESVACPVPELNTRDEAHITINFRVGPPPLTVPPCYVAHGSTSLQLLGPLPVGSYQVTANFASDDGSFFESRTVDLKILATEGRCNRNPLDSPSIYITYTPSDFIHRFQTEAGLAARLGNPHVAEFEIPGYGTFVGFDYPPLEDIPPALDRLQQAGVQGVQRTNGVSCQWETPQSIGNDVVVFEYYNAMLDQYFYTSDADEIAAIGAGMVGPGWAQTGKTFGAYGARCNAPDAPDAALAVYRFEGTPATGTGSHFFTSDRTECSIVNKTGHWAFASVPFMSAPPTADGSCETPTVPLYRTWRPFDASVHRLTTDHDVIDQMVAKGWVDEGQVMCVLPAK